MPGPQSFSRKDISFLFIIFIVIFVLYAPAINDIVVFDDAQFIRDGRLRTDLVSALPRFVTNITFSLVSHIAGASIAAQKLFNIAIHCGVVALLFLFTKVLLRDATIGGKEQTDNAKNSVGDIPIKIGVTLFALNPVAVYSVAYLAQRTILLATFFTLAMSVSFLKATTLRKPAWFGIALLCYGLAVLSKELAVTAIFIPALLYVYRNKLRPRQLVAPAIGALVLTGLVVFYFLTQYHISLMAPYEPAANSYVAELNAIRSDSSAHIFLLNALNQSNLFFVYGLLWLFPNPQWMSIDLHPIFPTLNQWGYYVPLALAYIIFCVAAVKLLFAPSNRSRVVGALLLMPLIFFTAELFIIRLQEPLVLYRSYLWAIGIPGLVAVALSTIKRVGVVVALGVATAVSMGVSAINRVHVFTDNFLLWTDVIETSERYAFFRGFGSWRAYINRGSVYLNRSDVRHALEDFNHADRLGALSGVAKFNAGIVFQTLEQHELAIDAFKAAEHDNHVDPMLQYHIAESFYAIQRLDSALSYYDSALALVQDPATSALVRTRKAETLVALRRFGDAKLVFDELLASKPGDTRATIGRGMASIGLGNFVLAEQSFNAVLQAAPNANAHYGIALLRESQSRWNEALAAIAQAIAMEPNNAIYQEYQAHLRGTQPKELPRH